MILPDSGRIIIIDDKDEEGLPLLKALVKEGHLASFFTERKEGLPKKPLSGIRVVFLDLILGNEYQSERTVTSTIQNVLNNVIDKDKNGPFILIAWTNKPEKADCVRQALQSDGFRFLMTMMEKQECQNDNGKFSVQKIQMRLKESVRETSALQFFILWENMIHRAAGNVVNDFSNLANMDNCWNQNMELVIAKLAKSVLGDHFDNSKIKEVIDNAMYSTNTVLVDAIHQETKYSPKTTKIDLSIPNIPNTEKTSADGELNSRLLLKQVKDQFPVPGNIYSNNMKQKAVVKELFNGTLSEFPQKDDLLSKVKHIVLEITPACDYAEQKALVNRLLPGIIWPHKYVKQIKHKADFSYVTPVFRDKNGELFYFVFDFRTFTSVKLKELDSKRPIYTVQNELLADIQSKLARHVSRLGVVSVV